MFEVELLAIVLCHHGLLYTEPLVEWYFNSYFKEHFTNSYFDKLLGNTIEHHNLLKVYEFLQYEPLLHNSVCHVRQMNKYHSLKVLGLSKSLHLHLKTATSFFGKQKLRRVTLPY